MNKTLFFNIGQCGNNLGTAVLQTLTTKNKRVSAKDGILVDSEPRVIQSILKANTWEDNSGPRTVYFDHGRGNNWAMSYSKQQKKKKAGKTKEFLLYSIKEFNVATENQEIIDTVLDFTRKQIEQSSTLPNFFLFFGLAGGTGSGIGSRVAEELRGYYPFAEITAHIIFPLRKGETPLQHYNIGLSLAHLHDYSDYILYNDNQSLLEYLEKKKKTGVGFKEINKLICGMLAEILNCEANYSLSFLELMEDIVRFPGCKMIRPFGETGRQKAGKDNWKSSPSKFIKIGKSVLREIKQGSGLGIGGSCLVRYKGSEENGKFKDRLVSDLGFKCHESKFKTKCAEDEHLFTLTNRGGACELVENNIINFQKKYDNNAFLHWYSKFGVDKQQMLEALEKNYRILDSYREFASLSNTK